MSNNQNKILPKLRFPEFVNDEEWKEKKFDDLCKFVRGPFGGALKKEIFVNEGYAVYEQQHAIYNDFTSFRYFISQEKYNELKRFSVLPKDIIMSCSGTMGKFAVIPENPKEGVINQALLKLTVKPDYEIGFIKTSFELPVTQNKLLSQSAGGAIKNVVEVAQIKEIKLLIPERKEQQKIASCLSSLDDVIRAECQKLELLKDHKKGLLQNLFPKMSELGSVGLKDDKISSSTQSKILKSTNLQNPNSDNVPKFRFKEFQDLGEWEEKTLGEVADFINGRAYKQQELLSEGKYRVLRVGNFFTNNEWYYSSLELDEDKYCDNGDLLYAWSASFGPKIWIGEKVIYHYHIWKVKNKLGIDKKFLFNVLDFETGRMKAQMANGFALLHITKGTIENWLSHIPKSEKEQQKIASTLSSIDDLIKLQAQKIKALQLHKKGLLQGLFPDIGRDVACNVSKR